MIINKILNFYLKVLRLESCYKPHNIYIVILILLLTLISVTFPSKRSILFFEENILLKILQHYISYLVSSYYILLLYNLIYC